MSMLIYSALVTLFLPVLCTAQTYPSCWIRTAECLDNNQPPLDIPGRVKPGNNSNVLEAVEMLGDSTTECATKCREYEECQAFTVYSKPTKDCQLVGFNLGTACWRLSNVCVLHRECKILNSSCSSGCSSGLALPSPKSTVILGGVTKTRGENDTFLNYMEILRPDKSSCKTKEGTSPTRLGAVAMTVGSSNSSILMMCSGWTQDDGLDPAKVDYLNTCSKYTEQGWVEMEAKINNKRAFGCGVAVADQAFIMGGYNQVDGFLDSVEVFKDGAWAVDHEMKMKTPTSNACAVEDKGNIYLIGGWDNNFEYLATAAVLDVKGKKWSSLPDMEDIYGEKSARGDHDCLSVRRGWNTHIVVAGGYVDGSAWLSSALYLDTSSNNWHQLPRLKVGRHNHGLGIVGLDPVVLGGWSSKVISSTESLDSCGSSWTFKNRGLASTREKFSAVVLPEGFNQEFTDCPI